MVPAVYRRHEPLSWEERHDRMSKIFAGWLRVMELSRIPDHEIVNFLEARLQELERKR